MLALGTARPISGAARRVVPRPLESVFDVVGHGFFANDTRWSPQVVKFEPLSGSLGRAGATARQVTVDGGIRTQPTFEIATVGPPRLLSLDGLSAPDRRLRGALESRMESAC